MFIKLIKAVIRTASVTNITMLLIILFSIQTGDSALILAAWHGHTDIVVELVKAGAKLDLQDEVQ